MLAMGASGAARAETLKALTDQLSSIVEIFIAAMDSTEISLYNPDQAPRFGFFTKPSEMRLF